MTKHECAIIMAHTGVCMLTDEDFSIFHKYVENILGYPVYTHEIGLLKHVIKKKSTEDFINLCREASNE